MKPTDTTAEPRPDEKVEQWPTDKVLVSEHNTRQPKPKEVAELMRSIKATRQSTPAIARPHPSKKGFLELGAGARRRTACHALGITLDVIVRDLTDDELKDLILTENLQREDPDPEAEADLIQLRLDEGATPSEIAARYGKPESWVKRRAKLLGVIPAIRKRFKKDLSYWSIEMRERLGALEPDLQKKLASPQWVLSNVRSMADLIGIVKRHTADLKGCKTWLKDPDTFVKGCGPGCANSSDDDLFADGCSGRCRTPDCFNKRRGLHIDKQIDAALAGRTLSDVVVFRSEGWGEARYKGKELKVLDRWQFDDHYTVSKTETDLPALDFANPANPKLVFLTAKTKRAAGGTLGKRTPGKKEPRENKVHAKRLAALNERLKVAIKEAPRPAKPSIVLLAAVFGTQGNRNDGIQSKPTAWKALDTPRKVHPLANSINGGAMAPEDALWSTIRDVLHGRLTYFKNADMLHKDRQEEMRRLAGLIGFDYDAQYAEICLNEVKVPKSWGDGIDPITLKKARPATVKKRAVVSANVPGSGKSKLAKAAKKTARKATKKTARKRTAKTT